MTELDVGIETALDLLAGAPTPVRIAVVGDVILDRFLYGEVDRISPEAPVPVVDVEREVFRLGGAANVVHNLRALGAEVLTVGVVGDDDDARWLRRRFESLGADASGLAAVTDRPTAVKTRVVARNQQVVRFDRERRGALTGEDADRLWRFLEPRLGAVDGVILSDYGKGLVDARLTARLVPACRGRGVFLAADPVPANAGLYRGVSIMTPNRRETERMWGGPVGTDDEAVAAGRGLMERYDTEAMLVTRGERGMTLVTRDGVDTHIPTRARDVFDVTGAGDTAVAVLTLARAAGAPLEAAAGLANLASGLVVGKLGTAVVCFDELAEAAEGS